LVCLTSLNLDQGGIACVNRNIVKALRCIGRRHGRLEVRALVYHGDDPQESVNAGEDPIRFRASACQSSRFRFALRYAWLCTTWRPSLVFVDHLHLAVVPYLLRHLHGAPRVLFCHGIEFDESLSRLRRSAFMTASLRLSNSQFTARRLMCLFPDYPVEPCELGLEESPDDARIEGEIDLPDAFGRPQRFGEHAVLIVSRMAAAERYKGHDQLLDIFPSVREAVASAQLVIAGEGDDRPRLMGQAREGGAGEAVLFSGFATPALLTQLFARCRLFAMPSRGEGFGLVYLEAMRFAKPCIASRTDGGSEVVLDGITGLHVDPEDRGQLREALLRLLTDDQLARSLGQGGLARLDQMYRFEHFQRRLQQRLGGAVIPSLAVEQCREQAGREVCSTGQ
jgi:phosphatidylinositol alpha-1,6-mannosyltransferase